MHIKRCVLTALLGFVSLFFFQGCSASGNASQGEPNPSGVFIDSTFLSNLQASFDQVKACTGFSTGEFEAVAVVIMPPTFPCRWYEQGCSGEFETPNTIHLGSTSVWKHEALHYLLYINTGDSDQTHQSPFFQTCIKSN